MKDLEKQVLNGEEEKASVLDFDMLCAKVALQTQGRWTMVPSQETHQGQKYSVLDDNDNSGGVFRMWEGEVLDCFADQRVAIESFCCPCYRFGKNMRRAAFGSCFLQGFVHYILSLSALLNFIAFAVTEQYCFLYLAVSFTLSLGIYSGFFRTQIRKKFNIRVTDGYLDDCIYHILCPCCSLSQESRTLEINNVQDGTWHGRGDTLCIGSCNEVNKAVLELHPPPAVSTESEETMGKSKSVNVDNHSSC